MWLMKILTLQFPKWEKNKEKRNILCFLSSVCVCVCVCVYVCVCVCHFLQCWWRHSVSCVVALLQTAERSRIRPQRECNCSDKTRLYALKQWWLIPVWVVNEQREEKCLQMHRQRWRCECVCDWICICVSGKIKNLNALYCCCFKAIKKNLTMIHSGTAQYNNGTVQLILHCNIYQCWNLHVLF